MQYTDDLQLFTGDKMIHFLRMTYEVKLFFFNLSAVQDSAELRYFSS